MTLSVGEPKRNKDYQKAHFPKRTTDDTESQAMARFAIVELPPATAPISPAMIALREVAGRLKTKVKQLTQAINRLHNLLARVFPELANLTNKIAASWVLELLDKYPTAQRIGQARLASLQKIPYLAPELAGQLHLVAQQSVACLSGDVAEALVRDLVAQVRQAQRAKKQMEQLLADAYAALPDSPHRQVVTIRCIGVATAAAIIAQAVDINRFPTPEQFVGYFGVFPEENSSGVDKDGNPLPAGTMCMSSKGTIWPATICGMPLAQASAAIPPLAPSIVDSRPTANAATLPWVTACVPARRDSTWSTPSGKPIGLSTTSTSLGKRPTPRLTIRKAHQPLATIPLNPSLRMPMVIAGHQTMTHRKGKRLRNTSYVE